jgi:hypothetical protein
MGLGRGTMPYAGATRRNSMETSLRSLFRMTEYDAAGRQFFFDAVDALMNATNPLLGQMKHAKVDTLPTTRLTAASGAVMETSPMAVEFDIKFSIPDLISGDPGAIYASITAAADSGLDSFMPQFFQQLSDVCDAAGQTISAEGRPLSHDLLLDLIEGVEIDFSEDGEPRMPTLVMHPDMAEKLRALPPPTPEQEARHRDIVERKLEEYRARGRTRRLPRYPD